MKTKRLLFGLIEMNRRMYNVLYTLLCVVVWVSVFFLTIFALCKLNDTDIITDLDWYYIAYWMAQSIFIGNKLFNKNNYT